jgi:hypothetical protein
MAEDTQRQTGSGQESTLALAGQVMEQARRLVRQEVESTLQEFLQESKRLLSGGALLVTGAGMELAALGAFSVSLFQRLRDKPATTPLLTGLALTGGATVLTLAGLRLLPRRPFAAPVRRVKQGLADLRSRLS